MCFIIFFLVFINCIVFPFNKMKNMIFSGGFNNIFSRLEQNWYFKAKDLQIPTIVAIKLTFLLFQWIEKTRKQRINRRTSGVLHDGRIMAVVQWQLPLTGGHRGLFSSLPPCSDSTFLPLFIPIVRHLSFSTLLL